MIKHQLSMDSCTHSALYWSPRFPSVVLVERKIRIEKNEYLQFGHMRPVPSPEQGNLINLPDGSSSVPSGASQVEHTESPNVQGQFTASAVARNYTMAPITKSASSSKTTHNQPEILTSCQCFVFLLFLRVLIVVLSNASDFISVIHWLVNMMGEQKRCR